MVSHIADANGNIGPGSVTTNPSPTANNDLYLTSYIRNRARLDGLENSERYSSGVEKTYETDKSQFVYLKSTKGVGEGFTLLSGSERLKTEINFELKNDDTKLHPVQRTIYPLSLNATMFENLRPGVLVSAPPPVIKTININWGSQTRSLTKTWEPVRVLFGGSSWNISSNISFIGPPPFPQSEILRVTNYWNDTLAHDPDNLLPKTLPPLTVQPY
jgi:hypothetical protein